MADLTVAIFQATPFSTLNIFARAAQADAVILLTTAQFTAKSPDATGTKKLTGMKHIRVGGCQPSEWLPLSVAKELQRLIETPLGKGNWRDTILSQISFRYQHAPYFEKHFPDVKEIIEIDTSLGDLSEQSFRWAHSNLALWSHVYTDREFRPKQRPKGGWILDLCLELGADRLITGAPSLNYMDREEWHNAGVELMVQDWTCAQYQQHGKEWTPNLSVIDSIFYNDMSGTRLLVSTGFADQNGITDSASSSGSSY